MTKQDAGVTLSDAIEADDFQRTRELLNEMNPTVRSTVARGIVRLGKMWVTKMLVEEFKIAETVELRSKLLASAAGSGHLEVAQYLLGLGIGNLYSDLPLTRAAMSGNLELVKLLLDAGADPNQGNKGFENALDIAIRDGHDDIADCLRSHGAQPGVCVYPE